MKLRSSCLTILPPHVQQHAAATVSKHVAAAVLNVRVREQRELRSESKICAEQVRLSAMGDVAGLRRRGGAAAGAGGGSGEGTAKLSNDLDAVDLDALGWTGNEAKNQTTRHPRRRLRPG